MSVSNTSRRDFAFGLALLACIAQAPAVGIATPASVTVAAPTTAADGTAAAAITAANSTAAASANATGVSLRPEIVAVYPNPAVEGDAGEFVVVRFARETNGSRWALTDGESTVALPDTTVSGRVALSADPRLVSNRTDLRVVGLGSGLSLSNAGETVRLVAARGSDVRDRNSTPVANGTAASVTYADAPEAERWHRADDGWTWTPLGATDFAVARAGPANATAFVLPDAPEVPLETLRTADDRLLLAGYTLTSERVADALAAAARRGATVRVLVEGDPVGGLTRREARVLDSLSRRGVEVRVVSGPLARYAFHHPKYAVADDRALVLTENWKPAGTGGRASRGWGVVLRSPAVADRLAAVFRADAGWRGAVPWSEFRHGANFETARSANGSYPTGIAPERVRVESSSVLVAPDNAEAGLLGLLDSADESIRVQQVAIGDARQPFLRATLRAARRGVEVEILLSSAWYVAEDNRALVDWLNERAEREGLELEARMANPRGRYEKIHAKGVVVDDEAAVVGSLNWNNNSARRNREVAVVLRGEEVAGYYARAFDSDWEASAGDGDRKGASGSGDLPVGLLVAVAVGAIAAILVARGRIRFE